MASVNLFSLFAFICLALTLNGASAQNGVLQPLASLREYPSYLHRCTGSFVSPNFVLTTAACLLCYGKCDLFVLPVLSSLYDTSQPILIKSVFIHPKYEKNIPKYDVGLASLDGSAPPGSTLALPKGNVYNLMGVYNSWQFTPNLRDFRLQTQFVETITNNVCYSFFNEYVPDSILCVHSNYTLTVGKYDQGSPVYSVIDNRPTALGYFFDRPESAFQGTVLKFQNIAPFTEWIENIIYEVKSDSGLKGRPIFHRNRTFVFTTERPYTDPSPSIF